MLHLRPRATSKKSALSVCRYTDDDATIIIVNRINCDMRNENKQ